MIRKSLFLGAALTLAVAAPGLTAPTLKATVSHMCCGACETAIKGKVATVTWADATQADRPARSVTVSSKAGSEVDAMALFTALHAGGFPPTSFELSGAKAIKMDVGHLCCGGCVGPLQAALKQVTWIQSADVKPNSPVMLTIDASKTVDLSELMASMMKAGYSPKSMVCSE
jgi:copper chaperone CopZ